MSLNRWTLSLESLGERIVPDAAPTSVTTDPVAISISIPPSLPETVTPPVLPGAPQGQISLTQAEALLRQLRPLIRELEASFVEARDEMNRANLRGDGAGFSQWSSIAISRLDALDQMKAFYNHVLGLYKKEAAATGRAIPKDIADFDPGNIPINELPVLDPFVGGPYA